MNLNTSILQYIEDVKSGTFTVEEFVSETLQRIKNVDEKVHAYLSLNESSINDAKLIESLKNFREHYVRAPKMN